jgi:iron complex transport system ATP-binding protein
MIRVEDAGHWYRPDRWLFRHLSFRLHPGRIATILGPNGSGKTTLLRALCGTLRLKEGAVIAEAPIGYVPQALVADAAYRVIDMVLLGRSRYLGRFSAPRRSDVIRAAECLNEVGLSDIAEQRYDHLSGGQRQLVLLARALATDCRVLILDEPASALDLANQGVVLRLLQRLVRRHDLTVLFTTHDPDHALAVADDTLLILSRTEHVFGGVDAILTESNLARMYGVPVRRVTVSSETERVEAIIPLHGLR